MEYFLGGFTVYLINELITPKKDTVDVLKTREITGLTRETQKLINLVTTRPGVLPVGSFKYKVHKYPSDIDIFEQVRSCCTKEQAINQIKSKFQEMAKKIKAQPGVYLGDFKAGIDSRFDINLKPYDYEYVQNHIRLLVAQNLLTNQEYNEMEKLAKKNPSNKDLEDLAEKVRLLKTIRWNLDEMIAGRKEIRGNVEIDLKDAITHDGIVKIDIWAKYNNRYNEITNFFLLIYKDKEGNEHVLNAKLGDRLEAIEKDIKKYSSKSHYNPLKVGKRLWLKAVFQNDKSLMNKLYPLFSSGAASLGQINGEIEVLINMFKKLKNPPVNDLLIQIDEFKRRINDIYDIDLNTDKIYSLLDQITNNYSKEIAIKNLETIFTMLKKYISLYASKYLKNKNLL